MVYVQRFERRPPRLLGEHGSILFGAFCVGAVVLFVLIETPFNAGLGESAPWCALAWLVLVVGYVVRYWRWLVHRVHRKRWKVVLLAALLCPVLVLMTWPYALLVNAMQDRGDIVHEGEIERAWISGGKYRTPVFDVRNPKTHALMQVQPTPDLHSRAHAGDRIRCTYTRGALGIAYRWRYGDAPAACTLLEQ